MCTVVPKAMANADHCCAAFARQKKRPPSKDAGGRLFPSTDFNPHEETHETSP
jgi:hypothetical protein